MGSGNTINEYFIMKGWTETMLKRIKLLVLTMLLTSVFCCTAFASTREQEVSSTENVANDVVYDKPDISGDINPAIVIPAIETFQVKSVRVYPEYTKPEEPGKIYYNKNIYAVHTIPGNNWGQNNFLEVSPETTERLLHSFDDKGYEVVKWRMEMDCYVANYKRPSRFEFKSLDGSQTISTSAYNGTRTFNLIFPVQDTTKQYGNGYDGTFSYYSTNGNYVSIMAGGYVYLNSTSSNAK